MKIYKEPGEEGEPDRYYYRRRDFKLVDTVYQEPFLTMKDGKKQLLGYLPAGEKTDEEDYTRQELVNYGEKLWFAFEDTNGKRHHYFYIQIVLNH